MKLFCGLFMLLPFELVWLFLEIVWMFWLLVFLIFGEIKTLALWIFVLILLVWFVLLFKFVLLWVVLSEGLFWIWLKVPMFIFRLIEEFNWGWVYLDDKIILLLWGLLGLFVL